MLSLFLSALLCLQSPPPPPPAIPEPAAKEGLAVRVTETSAVYLGGLRVRMEDVPGDAVMTGLDVTGGEVKTIRFRRKGK